MADDLKSNRFFRAMTDQELEASRRYGGIAWQGINAGRAHREMVRRRTMVSAA